LSNPWAKLAVENDKRWRECSCERYVLKQQLENAQAVCRYLLAELKRTENELMDYRIEQEPHKWLRMADTPEEICGTRYRKSEVVRNVEKFCRHFNLMVEVSGNTERFNCPDCGIKYDKVTK